MLCTHTMPRTNDAALKQREGRLHGIRVQITDGILPEAVIDSLVLSKNASFLDCFGVRREVVRHNYINIFGHVIFDVLRQCSRLHIISVKEPEITATLPDANYYLFGRATSALRTLRRLSSNVGFIYFDCTVKFRLVFFGGTHSSPNAMAEIPCGFVADSKHPFKLVGAHSLAGLAQHVGRKKPLYERKVSIMEDSSRSYRELIAA